MKALLEGMCRQRGNRAEGERVVGGRVEMGGRMDGPRGMGGD